MIKGLKMRRKWIATAKMAITRAVTFPSQIAFLGIVVSDMELLLYIKVCQPGHASHISDVPAELFDLNDSIICPK